MTSSQAISFWISFYEKVQSFPGIPNFMEDWYNLVFQTLLEKTARKDLPEHLIRGDEEGELEEDETDDGEICTRKVTFEEYRGNSMELYEVILRSMKSKPGGVDRFFDVVSNLLQDYSNSLKVELGLFIVYSSILVVRGEDDRIIPRLIDYSSKLHSVNPNIKKSVLKVFSLLVDEIRAYDKMEAVVGEIILYLSDPEICELASRALNDLMDKYPVHSNLNLVEGLLKLCIGCLN